MDVFVDLDIVYLATAQRGSEMRAATIYSQYELIELVDGGAVCTWTGETYAMALLISDGGLTMATT